MDQWMPTIFSLSPEIIGAGRAEVRKAGTKKAQEAFKNSCAYSDIIIYLFQSALNGGPNNVISYFSNSCATCS